jgi:hypothetical protein
MCLKLSRLSLQAFGGVWSGLTDGGAKDIRAEIYMHGREN